MTTGIPTRPAPRVCAVDGSSLINLIGRQFRKSIELIENVELNFPTEFRVLIFFDALFAISHIVEEE